MAGENYYKEKTGLCGCGCSYLVSFIICHAISQLGNGVNIIMGMSKKAITILISAIIVISALSGFLIWKVIQNRAEVPIWEVGDNWKFTVNYENSEEVNTDYAYEVTVWENNSFGDESFYILSGYSSIFFENRIISKRDLRPIELIDYENKSFNRTGMEFNFPLFHGKKWNFTDLDGIDYNYFVEKVSDIEVPAGIFDGYKITKSIGNETETITYYSPEVRFVFMKLFVEYSMSGNKTISLHSYENIETQRKISTEELNNKYDARLEKWEFYSSQDYYPQYRLIYTYEDVEYETYFYEGQKQFLDNIINYTNEDDKILCWWNYGHMIRGYTGRDVIIDGPSERIWDTTKPWNIQNWNNDTDVKNVAKALTGTPEEAMAIMNQYNASLIYVGPNDFIHSVYQLGTYSSIVKGADENPDDHYEIMAKLTNGNLVPLEEANTGYNWWDGYSTQIVYKEPYYNSMIYRTRFGYSGTDIGLDEDAGIPGISGDIHSYPIMPLWNITNFNVIYRTQYWNPYPPDEVANHTDAWIEVDYWDAYEKQQAGNGISDLSDRSNLLQGNIILRSVDNFDITGTVKKNDGSAYSGIRVTAHDEYGVPKNYAFTDAQGEYSLKMPAGKVKLFLSEGLIREPSLIGETEIYSCEVTLTDDILYHNFTEPSGFNYTGYLYKDLDKNNEFNGADTPYINANMTLISESSEMNCSIQTDASGYFSFNNIPRGIYAIEWEVENRTMNRTYGSSSKMIFSSWYSPSDVQDDIGIPLVNIFGRVSNSTTYLSEDSFSLWGDNRIVTNISGVNVTMLDTATNITYVTVTDQYGNYTFENLLPGIYILNCDNQYFRYYEYEKLIPHGSYGRDVRCDFSYGTIESLD